MPARSGRHDRMIACTQCFPLGDRELADSVQNLVGAQRGLFLVPVVEACPLVREIDRAVAKLTGKALGGLDRVMKGYDAKPTITTGNAARAVGLEADGFVALAKAIGVAPKRRADGGIWSEWALFSVRRSIWRQEKSGG